MFCSENSAVLQTIETCLPKVNGVDQTCPSACSAANAALVSKGGRKKSSRKTGQGRVDFITQPLNGRTLALGSAQTYPKVLNSQLKAQAVLQTIEDCLPKGDGQENR